MILGRGGLGRDLLDELSLLVNLANGAGWPGGWQFLGCVGSADSGVACSRQNSLKPD
jgi:hypothetical protein